MVATFFEERKRAGVAQRAGICVNTYDSHRHAAFCSLRHLLTKDAERFTDVDHSRWFDDIEQLRERHAATSLRRASCKTGESSTIEGESSTVEGEGSLAQGERSTARRERGKRPGADAA